VQAKAGSLLSAKPHAALLTHSRNFFGNRFVYAVISQRAHGLSIGVNMNPDKFCNFDCAYCEVDRRENSHDTKVDLAVLSAELRKMLGLVQGGNIRELPGYQSVPLELLQLKEVALSGDGEPTLCPNFAEVVEAVVHVRAQRDYPFFKIVLITNSTGLHLLQVQFGIRLLTAEDEIWAKLDAGTQEAMDRLNRPRVAPPSGPNPSLEQITENIINLGRQRPLVIQSLFPMIDGQEPTPAEIEAYVLRLREIQKAGARISLVQVYSAHRPAMHPNCTHLPLRSLSKIAQRVREVTGLKAEVF
jgi:wyosine [tRNA(Phe)-imidazoG37] synthetase (radical SAM superfamily)